MFAVPGWAVVAPLKLQTESKSSPADAVSKQEQGIPKSLKRKRSAIQQAQHVSADNVEKLWDQHIDHKVQGSQSNKKKQKKKNRRDKSPPSEQNDAKQNQAKTEEKGIEVESKQSKKAKDNHEKPKKERKNKHTNNAHQDGSSKSKPPPTVSASSSTSAAVENAATTTTTTSTTATKLTSLQASMAAKLSSARFRHLNEQLYTRPSSASRALFEASPDLFAAYHTGFRQQVAVWPSNPVDGFIADVRRRARNASLPHRSSVVGGGGSNSRRLCVLADLGCGDAGLARTLVGANNKNSGGGGDDDGDIEAAVSGMTVRLHSFDLHAANHFVTAADVSALPLPAGSVDVAVLCLALMGTNWPAFVDEAWRVLRERGELWVAEIKSRFGRSTTTTTAATSSAVGKIGTLKENGNNTSHRKMNGKSGSGGSTTKADRETTQAEHDAILAIEVDGLTPSVAAPGQPPHADSTDVSAFVALLRAHGFDLAGSERESVDRANKMFVKMRFVKAAGRLPARGKNAGPATVLEGTGGFGDRFGRVKKKKRFLDNVDDDIVPQEEEAKILKPCVYKLR